MWCTKDSVELDSRIKMDYKAEYEKLLEKNKKLEQKLRDANFDLGSLRDDSKSIKEKNLKMLIDQGLEKDAKYKKLQSECAKQMEEYKVYCHK